MDPDFWNITRVATRRLVEQVPDLRESFDSHLAERGGELVPYTYLPDAVRDLAAKSIEGALRPDTLAKLGAGIEDLLRMEHPEVRNLVGLALIEELANNAIWPTFEPNLGIRGRRLKEEMGFG